jgi:hypothetical protein
MDIDIDRSVNASPNFTPPGVYEDAMADWNQQFPQFAKYGWGPSVQAEKWNGRHAMCEFNSRQLELTT